MKTLGEMLNTTEEPAKNTLFPCDAEIAQRAHTDEVRSST